MTKGYGTFKSVSRSGTANKKISVNVKKSAMDKAVAKKVPTLSHSARARQNMTGQLRARYNIMKTNLANRERELKKTQGYAKYLPNAKVTADKQKKGIAKVKKDIATLKIRIKKLQKEGKINKIL